MKEGLDIEFPGELYAGQEIEAIKEQGKEKFKTLFNLQGSFFTECNNSRGFGGEEAAKAIADLKKYNDEYSDPLNEFYEEHIKESIASGKVNKEAWQRFVELIESAIAFLQSELNTEGLEIGEIKERPGDNGSDELEMYGEEKESEKTNSDSTDELEIYELSLRSRLGRMWRNLL